MNHGDNLFGRSNSVACRHLSKRCDVYDDVESVVCYICEVYDVHDILSFAILLRFHILRDNMLRHAVKNST